MKYKNCIWYIVLSILEMILFCLNVEGAKEIAALVHLMQIVVVLTFFALKICNQKELFIHSVIHISVSTICAYMCFLMSETLNISFLMAELAIFLLFASSFHIICAGVFFSRNSSIVLSICVSVFVILVVSFDGLSVYWMTSGHDPDSYLGSTPYKIIAGVTAIYGVFFVATTVVHKIIFIAKNRFQKGDQ